MGGGKGLKRSAHASRGKKRGGEKGKDFTLGVGVDIPKKKKKKNPGVRILTYLFGIYAQADSGEISSTKWK